MGEPDFGAAPKKLPDDRVKRFEAIYRGIWSDDAPPGYLEDAASSMNLVEFEAHEKSKPAFIYSPLFKEMEQGIDAQGPAILQGMVNGG